jgi:hypothetical protein
MAAIGLVTTSQASCEGAAQARPAAKRYVRLKRRDKMKRAILTVLMVGLLFLTASATEDTQQNQSTMPPGMKGGFATVQGTIEKVFAVDDNGARFRAYQVRWKDYEVIVSDPLATTDFNEGDQITFMAQRIELKDQKVKTLNFMIINFNAYKK